MLKAFLAVRTGRQGGWRGAWRPVSAQARRAGRLPPLLVLLHYDQLRSSSVAAQHFRLSFFRCCECGRQKSLFWSLWGGAVLPGVGFSVDQEGLPTTLVIAAGWGMIVHRSLAFRMETPPGYLCLSKSSTLRTSLQRSRFQTPPGSSSEQKLPMTPHSAFSSL